MRDTTLIRFAIFIPMTPMRMLHSIALTYVFKVSRLCDIYLNFQGHTFEMLIYLTCDRYSANASYNFVDGQYYPRNGIIANVFLPDFDTNFMVKCYHV